MPQNIAPPGLISLLAAALAQQPTKPLVLALDGRCGSGKTTLANTLARQFPASITLHTDDFYLPPAQRIRGWEKTPCANMDLARLRDEALRPAYEGQAVQYRAYSCREGAYLPARELAAQPLVILEGSYSHHPLLTGYETLRVFLTCAKEEQTRRLQAREGERYANFAARWVPLEEGYFAELKEDVSWFCKKFDYRYEDEPWKNSKDAVERAIRFLEGDLHKLNEKSAGK